MSFKKKAVSIPGRVPANVSSVPGRGPAPSSGPSKAKPETSILSHEGVKASVQTSHPTTSTGSEHLDSLLGHMGIPLGSLLLVEESGSTDFASILLRSFASQGVLHQRLEANGNTKVVVVGQDEMWGKELPGVYVDKKQKKKQKVEEEESKVTVGNLSNTNKNMKIAWRYSRTAEIEQKAAEVASADVSANTKPNYNTVFDFTSRLMPAANTNEVTYINPSASQKSFLSSIITSLEPLLKQAQETNTVVRVLFPSFLHPVIFGPNCSSPNELMPFFHLLHNLCRKYPYTVAMMVSLPLELYPRHNAITRWIEHQSDGVLQLDPFPEHLIPDTPETSSGEKPSQGLVHIFKLPVTSEKGVMVSRRGEHAFRVGRKTFEIREFGIPIDESEASKEDVSNPVDY
jgi:elongator complex protein 4